MSPRNDEKKRVDAYIGLGANLGHRRDAIGRAIDAIGALPDIDVAAISDLYETPARFVEDQPDFINAAAHLTTSLSPHDLLDTLLAIEHAMGRKRQCERLEKGPRVIDLDILFYADRVIDDEGLTIPHPDLHNRRFVLEPLCDIAPEFVHPTLGKTVALLLETLGSASPK